MLLRLLLRGRVENWSLGLMQLRMAILGEACRAVPEVRVASAACSRRAVDRDE